jgi:Histidine-specific methyltransferase, SAM-dependent
MSNTKYFYQDCIWDKIVNSPEYEDLGKREMEVLELFLQESACLIKTKSAIHLGIGSEREVPHILKYIKSIRNYVLVDISLDTLELVYNKLSPRFPDINFVKELKDLETPGFLVEFKKDNPEPSLILLTGNGTIFSNRAIDLSIYDGMKKDDLFLLTLEMPHVSLVQQYDIEPAYELISKSGIKASRQNTHIYYDDNDQCLKMVCESSILLSSYKPTSKQLRVRMKSAGFKEVFFKEYENIKMIGSLWEKI